MITCTNQKVAKERDEAIEALDATLCRAMKAERERNEARKSRDALRSLHKGQGEIIARLQREAEQPRPLTPDDITDEMVQRASTAYRDEDGGQFDSIRAALVAALTVPPPRPEGAEEIETVIRELVSSHPEDHYGRIADHLASRGVLPPLVDKSNPDRSVPVLAADIWEEGFAAGCRDEREWSTPRGVHMELATNPCPEETP